MAPYPDDPAIPDEELLRRRLLRHANWIKADGTLSSLPFQDRTTPERLVSVHRASIWTIDDVLKNYPGVGVAEVTAGDARANQHDVAGDPLPEDPSHAVLVPTPALSSNSKRKEAAYKLAKLARIVVEPPVTTAPVAVADEPQEGT